MNQAVADVLKERLKNTFFINFIICWCIVNHSDVLYFIFSDDKANVKLEFLKSLSFNFLYDILLPFVLVLLYTFLLPLINLVLMKARLNLLEPMFADFQKKENSLHIDSKLEIEDKRLDLVFREKERDAKLDEQKTLNQTKRTKSAELEAQYAAEKLASESKALAIEKERLAELEKMNLIGDLIKWQKTLDERESLLLNEKKALENEAIKLSSMKRSAEFVSVSRSPSFGDKVNINFSGSIDGVEFEGGKAENFELVIGSKRMIPGFEDGLVGRPQGQYFDINVRFPDEYHAEHLKGKMVKFNIIINGVYSLMARIV